MKTLLTSLAAIAVALSVTGCNTAEPIIEFKKAKIYEHKELSCLGSETLYYDSKNINLGVGTVLDLTGKNERNTLGSTFISQGGSQMMVSALMQGGSSLVNRHNVEIMMWEKDASVDKWLGDKGTKGYRKVPIGVLIGSDYYVTGAITSLDVNTESGGAELKVNGVGGGYRFQEIVVGGDFVITDTKTSKIIFAEKYHIKLYSQEIEAGVFKLFGSDIVNFGAGHVTTDPMQLSTRYMIDTAAADIIRKIYGVAADICDNEDLTPPIKVGPSVGISNGREDIRENTKDISIYPARIDS